MATIRRIVPSNSISDFRPSAPDAGGGFRLLAEGLDALYKRLEPVAMQEQAAQGEADFRGLAKQQIGGNATAYMSSSGGPVSGDWLKYSNQGAIRNDPLDQKLIDAMSFVGGMGITMDVVSGGQESNKPGQGTGSTRHNHGQSADVDFYKDGRKLDWNNPADLPILKEIVSTAKSRGVTGIGAGDDYMGPGRFHVGFGAPAVWGAGGKGANAPAWLVEAYNSSPGVTKSSSGTPEAAAAFSPTMLRDADGKLVSKLYDPSAGPILQAYNLAAQSAYQSEIFLKSTTDLMGLRGQFAQDPEGFKAAADAYLEGIVEGAPDLFKSDIRAGITKEAQQVFLGLLDAQQTEIRNRSANANGALIDKWSDGLSAAILGGDPKEIAAAQAQLSSALSVRERLPGLAWTPEQSSEVIRKAQEDGQRRVQTQQNDQIAGWKKLLKVVTGAAKAGGTSEYDDLIDNPAVRAALPEEWAEAMAFRGLADAIPSLWKTPPAQAAAFVADLKNSPAQYDFEPQVWGYAESAVAENAKALREDPIKRLGEIFPEDPPPPMPDLSNPEAIPEWLAARAAYAERRAEEGFMPKPVYVSKDEALAMGALFGKEVPADMKFAALSGIVSAMGPEAGALFDQISVSDKTVRAAGMALAAGVDPTIAMDALTGRERLDAGLVNTPEGKAISGGLTEDMRSALVNVPDAVPMMPQMEELAVSIYGAMVPANATPAIQKQVMEAAWNRALGQSQTPTGPKGGVQKVNGNPVWLPPTIGGEDVQGALESAFGFKWTEGFMSSVVNGLAGKTSDGLNEAVWQEIGGGIPAIEGEALTPDMWESGSISMVPVGGNDYRLVILRKNGPPSDVRIMGTDRPFIFDATKLVDAAEAMQ